VMASIQEHAARVNVTGSGRTAAEEYAAHDKTTIR